MTTYSGAFAVRLASFINKNAEIVHMPDFLERIIHFVKPNRIKAYAFAAVLAVSISFAGAFISTPERFFALVIYCYLYSCHAELKISGKEIKKAQELVFDYIYWFLAPALIALMLYFAYILAY